MSAFIVSKRHIDALVTALIQDGAPESEADEIGRILWGENFASVNARYREHTRAYRYTYEPVNPGSRVATIKAIDCYEYQSCEHEGWADSLARALMFKLRGALAASLRPGYRESVEYRQAAWEIR